MWWEKVFSGSTNKLNLFHNYCKLLQNNIQTYKTALQSVTLDEIWTVRHSGSFRDLEDALAYATGLAYIWDDFEVVLIMDARDMYWDEILA